MSLTRSVAPRKEVGVTDCLGGRARYLLFPSFRGVLLSEAIRRGLVSLPFHWRIPAAVERVPQRLLLLVQQRRAAMELVSGCAFWSCAAIRWAEEWDGKEAA